MCTVGANARHNVILFGDHIFYNVVVGAEHGKGARFADRLRGNVGDKAGFTPASVRRKLEEGGTDYVQSVQGVGFYDPISEMNRLFGEMFGGHARRVGSAQQGAAAIGGVEGS